MATHLLTVEAVFDIAGLGLVIVPGPVEDSYVGPREVAVRLQRPIWSYSLADALTLTSPENGR